jgi:hypothetical protein
MGSEITQKMLPTPSRLAPRNYMSFPRELREAIPNLHTGRVLELESVNGQASNHPLFGPRVSLKLVVKETGKLAGEFVVRMDLQVDAARKLAATISQLADQADRSESTESVVKLSSMPEDE